LMRFQSLSIFAKGNGWITLLVIVAVLVALSWIQLSTALLMLGLLLTALFFVSSRFYTREEGFAWFLVFLGTGLTLGCEFFHVKDNFGSGNLARMNTVFKFYYQAWVFWAVASVYGVYFLYNQAWRWEGALVKLLWKGGLTVFVLSGLVYSVTAVTNKSNYFNLSHPTLDGAAYLKASYPADYDAIQWMKKNIKNYRRPPVILESYGDEYTEYARVSTLTGFPTVLGWPGHELQWRGSWDEQGKRIADIDKIYNSHDIQEVKLLLDKYNVEYVYVGTLERVGASRKGPYDSGGLAKFDGFMNVAYANFGVSIYKGYKK